MMSLPLTDVCVLERPSVKCKNKNLACLLSFQCFYYLSFPRNAQSSASTQPQPVLAFSQFNNSCVPCDLQTALCLSNNAIEGLHVRCLPSFVWTCVGEYGRSVCVLGYSLSLSLCVTVLWALSYRARIQACALNVASGRWAFKGMLSHADRQPCTSENAAGLCLLPKHWQDGAVCLFNNCTHCGLGLNHTAVVWAQLRGLDAVDKLY